MCNSLWAHWRAFIWWTGCANCADASGIGGWKEMAHWAAVFIGFELLYVVAGPEAMQLATYSGWRLHGTLGGLIAGLLFVLPGALVILTLASIYSYFGNLEFIQALFLGVKATVLIIVIQALLNVFQTMFLKMFWYRLPQHKQFV